MSFCDNDDDMKWEKSKIQMKQQQQSLSLGNLL